MALIRACKYHYVLYVLVRFHHKRRPVRALEKLLM